MSKILIDEATVELSLDALESCDAAHITDGGHQWYDEKLVDKAITDLREALAEQPAQQEPVAWMWRCKPHCGWPEWSVSLKRPADSGRDGNKRTEGYEDVPLYTTPPAPAQPLTDEQMADFLGCRYHTMSQSDLEFFKLGEAAHNIKENTC